VEGPPGGLEVKIIVVFLLLFSSASIACESDDLAAVEATICDIKQNPQQFEGRDVAAVALYRSDRRHFSLLTDDQCGVDRNTLQVGVNDSESAKELWVRWDQACLDRGDQGYCVVSERVRVIGRIRLREDGLFFDIQSMQLAND
jgi:hypothetical protein